MKRVCGKIALCLMAAVLAVGLSGTGCSERLMAQENRTEIDGNASVKALTSSQALREMMSRIQDGVDLRLANAISPGRPSAKGNAQALQEALNEEMDKIMEEYAIDEDSTGIAIHSLDGSISWTLNEDELYTGASLYKLPLAMIWYDRLEKDPSLLKKPLLYRADMYEDVSVIASRYAAGSYIDLEELLEQVILTSDNTAGHILFEHLGGWEKFKSIMKERWPNHTEDKDFVSMDNLMSPGVMVDVLLEIAASPERYEELIEDMENAQPANYLNRFLDRPIAQKYGAYGSQVNGAGLDLEASCPYVLCVMTDDIQAVKFVGDLALRVQSLLDTEEKQGE